MSVYVCDLCKWEYNEAEGVPEAGIAPGTKWEDLPEDFVCPICGAAKLDFQKKPEASGMPGSTARTRSAFRRPSRRRKSRSGYSRSRPGRART